LGKKNKFFKINCKGDYLDLKEQSLVLELIRPFTEIKFSGESFRIKFELWIIGLKPFYKIFELEGCVRKKDKQFILSLEKGKRADSRHKAGAPLRQEPNWDTDPLFGFRCTLKVKSQKSLGIKIKGGRAIEFFLPTFRFGEMGINSSKENLEKIKLRVGTLIHDKPTEVSGKIDVGWSSLENTIKEGFKEDLMEKYHGLSFADQSFLVTAENNDRAQIANLKSQRLESIVLHCVSAKAYCTDPDFYSSREDQVKNIVEMYDWQRCLEIFNKLDVGAHYIIARDGKICELANARMNVAHGGRPDRHPQMKNRGNARTIGIELIGHATDFRKEIIRFYKREKKKVDQSWAKKFEEFVRSEDKSIKKDSTQLEDYINADSVFYGFTEAQYEALKILLYSLGKRYGYIRICTHEWLKTTKSDPGDKFDWKKIKPVLVEFDIPQTEDFAFNKDNVYMFKKIKCFARRI